MGEADEAIVIPDSALVSEDIERLQKEIKEEPAQPSELIDNVIIIDNLPLVGHDKEDKLKNVLKRIYKVCEVDIQDIIMPFNQQDSKSLGFAFVEVKSVADVSKAILKTNNYKLDKSHILSVNRWSDLERVQQVQEEYVAPEVAEFQPKENMKWWLSDRREQYAILYGKEMEVFWHEPIKPQPEQIIKKSIGEPFVIQWSTYGSYIAVAFRGRRVMVRAGEKWTSVGNYEHKGLDNCVFSPAENYLTTFLPDSAPETEKEHYTVWDIPTGKRLRSFKKGNFFRWSHDDKYFARMTKDKISVYETPSCALLEKKGFVIPDLESFEWCPTKNLLAVFVLGQHNMPSFITLIEVPSRREVYRKSLFSVKTCVLKWQSEGKYLSVQVDRLNKSGKAILTSFEIFDVQKLNKITTEILPLPKGENVRLFEWEPTGNRFAIIHAEGTSPKAKVSFYQLGKKKLLHRSTLENRIAKNLFWSPRGSYLVIGGQNGSLEFYNAVLGETMSESDHYGVSALKWDPTGRYVCTYISAWRTSLDNGYVVRTFKGDVVHKVLKDQFYDFQWRPRPPSLLSSEKEAEIRSNLKDYAARYQKEDDGLLGVIVDARFKEQQRLLQEHRDRIKAYREAHAATRDQRIQLRGGDVSDDEDDYQTVTTTVETVVDEAEEELEPEDDEQ